MRLLRTKKIAISDDNGDPQYLLGVSEDITDRKRAEAQIEHMARHDALTDLPNRTSFTDRLAFTLDRAATMGDRFAVLCVDLDRFKEVNDVFGHCVGDAALRETSRRLQTAAEGAFLARIGGDEFALIAAEGPQPAAAAALANRLFAAAADDMEIDGRQLRVGLSVGVAIFPVDGTDATTLIGNADAALYRAKAEGRGTIRFFERDMDVRLRERRALQQDLRSALDRDDLTVHYQPQAQTEGEIVGFEALIRWRHPERGWVSPDAFIPLAEESGLIIPIGERMLREACREAASWPAPLRVAVNLSTVEFRHGDLPRLVHSVLLETGLAADRLELEVTESVLIGDFSRAQSILRRLKSLGVRIAMDDFGTGYSSLPCQGAQSAGARRGRGDQSSAGISARRRLRRGAGLSRGSAAAHRAICRLDLPPREGQALPRDRELTFFRLTRFCVRGRPAMAHRSAAALQARATAPRPPQGWVREQKIRP